MKNPFDSSQQPTTKPVEQPRAELEKDLAERVLDQQVEELLIKSAQKINEGNNGVIYRVEIPVDSEVAQKLGIVGEPGSSVGKVIKLLKVYQPGQGQNEYEMQRRVYELCEVARQEGKSVARVPQAITIRDLFLSEDAKMMLSSQGYNFSSGHADVIMMDYVEGVDLATYVFQEIVRRHPSLVHLKDDADQMSMFDLHSSVAGALGYSKPGGKARGEMERAMEAEAVANQNAELVIKYLEKDGFVLDRRVIDQVRAAINLMHANNLYHRDAHPRNIMINPESLGGEAEPEVYLIDFGATAEVEPNTSFEDIYSNGAKRYVSDEYVVNFFAPLTTTREEKEQVVLKKFLDDARSLGKRISRTKEWQELLSEIDAGSITIEETFSRLERWKILSNQELMIKAFTLVLLELQDRGKLNRDELIEFAKQKLSAKVSPFIHNSLISILKSFQ